MKTPATRAMGGTLRAVAKVISSAAVLCLAGCGYRLTGASLRQTQTNLYAAFDLSPDGRTLAFSGASAGGRGLFLLDLRSRRVTRLTDDAGYESDPAFAPDGRSVVYMGATGPDQPRHLYVRSLDGRHVRQLTGGAAVGDSHPSFSRDGRRVVFARALNFHADGQGKETWDAYDVCVVGADGRHLRCLSHEGWDNTIRPVFSPDGRSVLYERTLAYPGDCMYIVRVSAGAVGPAETLINMGKGTSSCFPAFFPDGREMALVFNDGRGPELYVRDTASGAVRCLGTRRCGDGSGGWSPRVAPDNKTVYFLMGYGGGLWRIGADGRGAREVADGSLFGAPTAWKP